MEVSAGPRSCGAWIWPSSRPAINRRMRDAYAHERVNRAPSGEVLRPHQTRPDRAGLMPSPPPPTRAPRDLIGNGTPSSFRDSCSPATWVNEKSRSGQSGEALSVSFRSFDHIRELFVLRSDGEKLFPYLCSMDLFSLRPDFCRALPVIRRGFHFPRPLPETCN